MRIARAADCEKMPRPVIKMRAAASGTNNMDSINAFIKLSYGEYGSSPIAINKHTSTRPTSRAHTMAIGPL